MQKYKSSRSGKTSQKFESGSLSQKSLNNIDESWKVIGNLKSGMRDLEEKLNKYSDNIKLLSSISNSSFNTTAHSINVSAEPMNKIFTSTSFNSALRPSGYSKSPSKYTIAEKPILENSYFSSTIQACDPGLGYFSPYQNDFENFSKYECDEPYEYSPDVKCLNDFSTDFNGSFLNFRSNRCQDLIKSPKTTKVDVYVPSGIYSHLKVFD
ncbi:hypothetical protein BpHYR1_017990 [Brachionus plicatilis]|uniref:Uncharacterized protein n=1 Tax=Brachionus plicatilis TaxID=10195 RepID=A0A3M7PJ22_BRAPC|nr:hypothetical protein BpHYR1_017990 [Brachionus plicatilis]